MKMVNGTAALLEALIRRWRTLTLVMFAAMGLVVVLDILRPSHYSRFPWDGVPGFTAVFAALGAMLLIAVYKAVGYGLVYRRPDYYQSGHDDKDEESSDG